MSETKFLANQNKKYYKINRNTDGSVDIGNQKYTASLMGKKVIVPEGVYTYSADEVNADFLKKADNVAGIIGTVIGELNFRGQKYIVANNDYLAGFFKVSDVEIQNGGVLSSFLPHLYQSLRALFNRKVVAYD